MRAFSLLPPRNQKRCHSRQTQRNVSRRHRYVPYVFLSPFFITFMAFCLWPIVKSFVLSFYATVGPKNAIFVGLGNFQYLLSDPDFYIAARNNVMFALCSVLLLLPLSLGLALLLSQAWLRGRTLLRLAFFLPNLLGQVFVGVLFSVLFLPHYGLVNKSLHLLAGIPLDTKWLADPKLVMPALVLTSLWMYMGLYMIYFLAALQAVDMDLYDAAVVDGANGWQKFLAVTLPGIRPVAVFVLLLITISSFQLFELPYLMLNNTAGPNKAGLTVVMYLYSNGFVTGDLGFASAVGWTLAFGTLVISLIQVRLTGALEGSKV